MVIKLPEIMALILGAGYNYPPVRPPGGFFVTKQTPELLLDIRPEEVFVELLESLAIRRETSEIERQQQKGWLARVQPRAQANLHLWMQEALRGAYAPNTVRAWKVDCVRFAKYCADVERIALPAEPETVRGFIQELFRQGKSLATIRRNLATISLLHSAAECPNPCEHVLVKLRMRSIARALRSRQKQARGLVWREIEQFLRIGPELLRDYRDRALVLLAYDTKFRSEEIVRVDVEHLHFDVDGTGAVELERSKTDQEGEGALAFLAQDTVREIKQWLNRAKIQSGPLFPRILGKEMIGERLRPSAVATVFRRIGLRIGLPLEQARRLTGHATRVGSTQDQLEKNQDIGVVMQSGRWKDARMVMRYGERQLAKRGGMAALARLQGRA